MHYFISINTDKIKRIEALPCLTRRCWTYKQTDDRSGRACRREAMWFHIEYRYYKIDHIYTILDVSPLTIHTPRSMYSQWYYSILIKSSPSFIFY